LHDLDECAQLDRYQTHGIMGRDCIVVSPDDAAQSAAGRIELSREMFDSRMRNKAFRSWEELLATLSDRPTEQGYRGLQGESNSVIRLDPVRIFGWTAVLLIQVCIWGLIGYFSQNSTYLGLAFTVVYGAVLWWIVHKALAPQLAGVLWPILPTVLAAFGVLVHVLLTKDWHFFLGPEAQRSNAMLALCLWICPQTVVAAWLLLQVREDPDRATLVMNVFAGIYMIIIALLVIVGVDDSAMYWPACSTMFLIGLSFVVLALRLFVNPGEWGSVELVSWMLNLGALAIFISSYFLLEGPYYEDLWPWLVYLTAITFLGVLGAVTGRSFSMLLAALGLTIVSGRLAWGVSTCLSSDMSPLLFFVTFGFLGMVIIGAGQWLQQSRRWAAFTTEIRCVLARTFGSQDLPYSWSQASQPGL